MCATLLAEEQAPASAPSPWHGLLLALWSPGRLQPLLTERAPWGAALLAQMGMALTAFLIEWPQISALVQQRLAAQQVSQGVARVAQGVAMTTSGVATVLAPLISILIIGLLLWIGALAVGADLGFRRALSLWAYAGLPLQLDGIVKAMLALRLPASSLAHLELSLVVLWPTASRLGVAILSLFDPFKLWTIALACYWFAGLTRAGWGRTTCFGLLLAAVTVAIRYLAA